MKKAALVLVLVLFSMAIVSTGQEQDAQTAAEKIWPGTAFVRKVGINYQVGCVINGDVIVVASSKQSAMDAVSKVNMKINGLHVFTATVRADSGETADSPPVPVILCNHE